MGLKFSRQLQFGDLDHGDVERAGRARTSGRDCRLYRDGIPIGNGIRSDAAGCRKQESDDRDRCVVLKFDFHGAPRYLGGRLLTWI